tara:strand:- start:17 stop:220 length:204 start_codon:yes stop_codon:yes gene_type:complete
MKKLLLAFSLIAIFGIGITTASITFPESKKNIENNEPITDNDTPSCCEKGSSADNGKNYCKKTSSKS